jgi:hypothetical protein
MLQARRDHQGTAPPPAAAIGRRPRLVGAMVTAVALASVALLACAGIASAASKQPAPPPATTSLTSPTALDQDRSGQLPVVNINEAPGDFLGEGHDQIASVQNGNLTISEAAKYGGNGRTTPTDLRATPNDGFSWSDNNGALLSIYPWQDSSYSSYYDVGASWSLTSVKVAASASNIYMAGATWDDNAVNNGDDPTPSYQLHLYKLRHDGECASAGCADKTLNLQSIFPSQPQRLVVATSLAVGVVGGRTLIAVGLSDTGIQIYDENLNLVTQIGDMDSGSGGFPGWQTPPIRLAFGPPSGSGQGGFLTAGVVSPWLTCYAWQLNSDGIETHMTRLCGDGVDTNIIASTAVTEVNGAPTAVFGVTNGAVYLVDFNGTAPFAAYGAGTAVTGLTGVTSWDDDPGNQHLVVGLLGGTGQVLKYLGAGVLQPIAIGPGGAKSAPWEQLREWFPGYGAGRLEVANGTAGPVSASMASSQDPGLGCWLNASVAGGASAFPTQATSVAAGQASPGFFIGALTAGVDGACASAQAQDVGERASYVVVTPPGDPADQRLVKLRVDRSGVVGIDSQKGGDLNAAVERAGGGGSWGGWRLGVSGHDDPVAKGWAPSPPPAVTGQRLTAKPGPDCNTHPDDPNCYSAPTSPVPDDPARPVYRFDVSGAQWGGGQPGGLGAGGQVTARIPAMTAQGFDGTRWKDLGRLMPSTAPKVSSDGTVTLGSASFFWQDGPGDAALTEVRVCLSSPAPGSCDDKLVSNAVTLADLAPPQFGPNNLDAAAGVQVAPATGGAGGATPRANGLDQAPLSVQLVRSSDGGGGDLPASDPRYTRVYYRDAQSLSLVTGLYAPGDYHDYVAVGPWRGAYPNDGVGRGRALGRGRGRGGPQTGPGRRRSGLGGVRSYLVTTSSLEQSLVGRMNDTGTVTAYEGDAFTVDGRTTALNASGTATNGVSLSGCASGPCTLADPTAAPALYQAGGAAAGPVIGLQFSIPAVTGVQSLPLRVGTGSTHNLASATLTVSTPPTQATLGSNASQFWGCDQIDTALVSSGDLVVYSPYVVGAGPPCTGSGRPR